MSREQYDALLEEHKPTYVVGFDEVGNGAIAGDLCVGACALPVTFSGELKDSKKYTEKSREVACDQVVYSADAWQVRRASPDTIKAVGHKNALDTLFTEALEYMHSIFGDTAVYIVDGTATFPTAVTHCALVKADDYVPAVSGASILAKCERDKSMRELAYPEWDFGKHKGYPTQTHLARLQNYGPLEGVHRLNVKTVQEALDDKGWYTGEETA